MMSRGPCGLWLGLIVAIVATSSPLWAEDESAITDDDVVVRTEGAHHFLLPKDWPVEHKDGVIAPVSVEKYLSMKFDQVRDALHQTDQRLTTIEGRLEQLAHDQEALEKRLQRVEAGLPNMQEAKRKEEANGSSTQTP